MEKKFYDTLLANAMLRSSWADIKARTWAWAEYAPSGSEIVLNGDRAIWLLGSPSEIDAFCMQSARIKVNVNKNGIQDGRFSVLAKNDASNQVMVQLRYHMMIDTAISGVGLRILGHSYPSFLVLRNAISAAISNIG